MILYQLSRLFIFYLSKNKALKQNQSIAFFEAQELGIHHANIFKPSM